ncbi:MAG TPA: flagellar hook-basal body complex protein FliE [Actinomycetales bacterium]|nr:flagellar hook-basal body complex protein FliE [Actinomycetales bacterium]
MTAIPALSAISLPTPVDTSLSPVAGSAGGADGTAGASFSTLLSRGLDHLQQTQATSDELATQAATGQLSDPAQYMIASTEAQVTTELTVALRNKAVDAFNEIMRMQA